MTDAEIIEQLGGSTALAKKLGLKTPDGARRVHNWKTRGIPAEVRLNFPRVFKLAKAIKRGDPAPKTAAPPALSEPSSKES